MKIELKRSYKDRSTIGELFIDGEFKCYTLERPWRNNRLRVSCIPEGSYPLFLKHYGRWHNHWNKFEWYKGVITLDNTEPRSEILIHPANWPREINGCIAPGISKGKNAVYQSRDALKLIYPIIADAIINKEDVQLVITSIE